MRDEGSYEAIAEDDLLAIKALAVVNCELCDDAGYRGRLICDHIDHAPAAQRGMAAIRRQMGWDRLKTAQRPAQPQESTSGGES